jgi:hypothetical protein
MEVSTTCMVLTNNPMQAAGVLHCRLPPGFLMPGYAVQRHN